MKPLFRDKFWFKEVMLARRLSEQHGKIQSSRHQADCLIGLDEQVFGGQELKFLYFSSI